MKLAIGFITYEELTAKYLPYLMPSLDAQSFQDFEVFVIDNSSELENDNIKYLSENYVDIDIEQMGENIGFARAHNKVIKKAKRKGAKYFLAINPDMILESNAIEKLVEAMDNNGDLGSVAPKVLRWDFKNNKKTDLIDTCGIKMKSGLRFFDLGQSRKDKGQFEEAEILGPSGCAAIYRMSALEKVKTSPQPPQKKAGRSPSQEEGAIDWYFDENMFMYKEDADLAYRLFLAGFNSRCIHEAIIYHDRTASGIGESNVKIIVNRKNKNKQVKSWSFLHQHIIFIKYWRLQSLGNKINVLWYASKMFIYVLVREQYLLKEYWSLVKLWKKIQKY